VSVSSLSFSFFLNSVHLSVCVGYTHSAHVWQFQYMGMEGKEKRKPVLCIPSTTNSEHFASSCNTHSHTRTNCFGVCMINSNHSFFQKYGVKKNNDDKNMLSRWTWKWEL